MNSAGTGTLIAQGEEIPVTYDLVAEGLSQSAARGQVFGDAEQLRNAFNKGPARLRLEDGTVATLILMDCGTDGAAEVRVIHVPDK